MKVYTIILNASKKPCKYIDMSSEQVQEKLAVISKWEKDFVESVAKLEKYMTQFLGVH